MLKYFILSLILFSSPASFAQIQIGDIEVESMSELFDRENTSLWNAFGIFNKSDSKIWISDIPSMYIDTGDQKAILLAIRKDIDQDSIRTVLIEQLNEQFGDYANANIPGMNEYSSLEWKKEENGITYLFSMSSDKKIGSLNIIMD